MALSEQSIKELLDSKEKLTEFSSTALIHAITAGVMRVQDPKTPPSAVSQFIESLRKVRADLTGDNHEMNVPQMMVNIQFGKAEQPVAISLNHEQSEGASEQPVAIDVTPKKSKPKKQALSKLDDDLLQATSSIFAESNIEPED